MIIRMMAAHQIPVAIFFFGMIRDSPAQASSTGHRYVREEVMYPKEKPLTAGRLRRMHMQMKELIAPREILETLSGEAPLSEASPSVKM